MMIGLKQRKLNPDIKSDATWTKSSYRLQKSDFLNTYLLMQTYSVERPQKQSFKNVNDINIPVVDQVVQDNL